MDTCMVEFLIHMVRVQVMSRKKDPVAAKWGEDVRGLLVPWIQISLLEVRVFNAKPLTGFL